MSSDASAGRQQIGDPSTLPPLSVRAKDAARLLGISERKLSSMTSAGEVPHVRIGRVVLFPVDQLKAWLVRRSKASSRSCRTARGQSVDEP